MSLDPHAVLLHASLEGELELVKNVIHQVGMNVFKTVPGEGGEGRCYCHKCSHSVIKTFGAQSMLLSFCFHCLYLTGGDPWDRGWVGRWR